ncbi:MAG: peptidoglycan DD-metalloendopeptidase family protein [Kistimonas sp.]|nr:peptidoglycan DD-metalloendopeptidase family protein [Kistimonas sp.]
MTYCALCIAVSFCKIRDVLQTGRGGMRLMLYRGGGLLLVACLLAVGVQAGQEAGQEKNSIRLEQVKEEIQRMQSLLKSIREQRSELEAQLENSEKKISRVQTELRQVEKKIRQAREAEKKYSTQRQRLKKDREVQQAKVAQALKAAYTSGVSPGVRLILNQDTLERVDRMLMYYSAFAGAQSEALQVVVESDRRLQAVETRIADVHKQGKLLRKRLQDEEKALLDEQRRRQKVVARLHSTETREGGRLERLQQEQQELHQLMESLVSIAGESDSSRAFGHIKGKMSWPVRGAVLHRYGELREEGKMVWRGVFIQAPPGRFVKSPHYGQVVFSGWLKSFGLLMIVDHGNEYMTLYAHNQSLLRSEGDWVLPGEDIALVGNSGGQSRAGLYFEVRHKGEPADPLDWLAALSRS